MLPTPCSMQHALVETARILRAAGIATPELDARVLLCHATGLSYEAYIARAREALPDDAAPRLWAALARRLKREPVSRILGAREFYGRSFMLGEDTLDPRSDTETLIEAALAIVRSKGWQERPIRLLDLGTGSGCILVTLLAELPLASGIGTDRSPGALAIAAANARAQGVSPRAAFAAADWLDGVSGKFDLVLSNPPYIAAGAIAGLAEEVRAHDPRLALDGGPDGLDAYRRIAARAREVLAPDGRLVVEIGAGQGEDVAAILAEAGLTPEAGGGLPDLAGRPRVVVAGR
ncbi:MAG: peptide chain release factor N(5)-glutamine methyltransferase [Methyloceanibacter sp.]